MRESSEALLVSAAAWALGITARVIGKGKSAEGVVASLAHRIGMGALRAAARRAVQLMGSHFVFGQTIEDASAAGLLERGAAYPLFLRHAGRRRADRRRCAALF